MTRFHAVMTGVCFALLVMLAMTLSLIPQPERRVAYLAPADSSAPANIWIDRQLTFSETGISGFSVYRDRIVFAEKYEDGRADLKLLDIETGVIQPLTDCTDSRCDHPSWSPDGRWIAYERVDFNSHMTSVGISPARVWLIDMNTFEHSMLFSDTQKLGHSAVWSAEGKKIAVYDLNLPGVRVYDVDSGEEWTVESRYGIAGFLSPDGSQLALPDSSGLQITNLATGQTKLINRNNTSADVAAWTPDGTRLAVSFRPDEGEALYEVDAATREMRLLFEDQDYITRLILWEGDQMLLQRAPQSAVPEIWLSDGKTLERLVSNAYNPRWVLP